MTIFGLPEGIEPEKWEVLRIMVINLQEEMVQMKTLDMNWQEKKNTFNAKEENYIPSYDQDQKLSLAGLKLWADP